MASPGGAGSTLGRGALDRGVGPMRAPAVSPRQPPRHGSGVTQR